MRVYSCCGPKRTGHQSVMRDSGTLSCSETCFKPGPVKFRGWVTERPRESNDATAVPVSAAVTCRQAVWTEQQANGKQDGGTHAQGTALWCVQLRETRVSLYVAGGLATV